MSKAAVVYWSGTGNTEEMANQVAAGAKAAGADVSVFTSADFNAEMIGQFDAIAFGCPSMGAEELEETEFAPMFDACEPKLRGKKVALFGSYGWGTNGPDEVAAALEACGFDLPLGTLSHQWIEDEDHLARLQETLKQGVAG